MTLVAGSQSLYTFYLKNYIDLVSNNSLLWPDALGKMNRIQKHLWPNQPNELDVQKFNFLVHPIIVRN